MLEVPVSGEICGGSAPLRGLLACKMQALPKQTSRWGTGTFGKGWRRGLVVLAGQQQARPAGGVDVAEQRGARRQQRRVQEVHVKVVAAGWRAVHGGAALEGGVGLAAGEELNDGALILQRAAPSLDVAQEVVHTAISAEVLCRARGLRERNSDAADDGDAVPGGVALTSGLDVGA